MTENFLKFTLDNRSMIQEAQINDRKSYTEAGIFKLQKIKNKEKIFKKTRRKKNTLFIEEKILELHLIAQKPDKQEESGVVMFKALREREREKKKKTTLNSRSCKIIL